MEGLTRDFPRYHLLASVRELAAALAIQWSAPLHDIGKVGIPDRVLLKPERLDRDEFEVMKTHAELGHRVLTHADEAVASSGCHFDPTVVRAFLEIQDQFAAIAARYGEDAPNPQFEKLMKNR